MLRNGEVINNHLVLETKGEGSFAFVYKVQHQTTADEVALKLCKSLDSTEMNHFRDENQILQTLSPHKNIVTPHSAPLTHSTNHIYYLMELADYHLEWLLTLTQDVITDEEKIRIFIEICDGLAHAHSNNVLHRDLHWENVLVVRGTEIKLADFGLGKQFNSTRFANSLQPRWGGFVCPPELYFKYHDNASPIESLIPGDVYSLGIILYYLFDNPPMGYVNEIFRNIQDFIINKEGLDLGIADSATKLASYKKWAKGVTPLNKLEVFSLRSDSANSKVNEIIRKATTPDCDLRYQNINEMLIEVRNIFV